MSKQPEVVITDESFVDAFVDSLDAGLNWARRVLAAATAKYGKDIPDTAVVNAEATLVKARLQRDGKAERTQKNRASVARKILRNHTVLTVALEKVESDKSWTRPAGRGFDQQTFEKLATCSHQMADELGKLPSGTAVAKRFIERMKEPKKGRTPAQKAAAAFKALQTSGTGAAKWVAVIDAAIAEARKQGIAIEE